MATLKQLKSINNRYKFAVIGYLREKEKEIAIINIPSMISYLCLQFYFHGEYFSIHTGNIHVSSDKMSATLKTKVSPYPWVYGKIWIESLSNSIATWTFKINGLLMKMGISSSEDSDERPYYHFFNIGHSFQHDCKHQPPMFAEQDIMKLTLNTTKGTITLQKNEEDAIEMFENIQKGQDIKYKFGVALFNRDNSITLIDFDLVQVN